MGLLTNQSPVSRSRSFGSGSPSVTIDTSKFFFYSNSPETLGTEDLADNGKYLNIASVNGTGQIYTWHRNGTGTTMKNCILVYNPNSYAVKVTVETYALTNYSYVGPDSAAWETYFRETQSTSITVAARGYGNLFLRNIAAGYTFGIIARVKITNVSTGANAGVTLYDLAYISNSGGGTSLAEKEGDTKARGKGAGYVVNITFPTMSPDAGGYYGYILGKTTDSMSGADCVPITDPETGVATLLAGAYGEVLKIRIPIKNSTGAARKFRIYIGSIGGAACPFAYYGGAFARYSSTNAAGTYIDVIETDTIANGSTSIIEFTTVVTAVASTPYIIGVRSM